MAFEDEVPAAGPVDLEQLLDQLSPLEEEAEFGQAPHAFRVRIRRCSAKELSRIGYAALSRKRDRAGNPAPPEPEDERRMHVALRDTCLLGWEGLTVGAFCAMTNLRGNGATASPSATIPYTGKNALVLLQMARAEMPDADDGDALRPIRFADWLYREAAKLARAAERREATEKKI